MKKGLPAAAVIILSAVACQAAEPIPPVPDEKTVVLRLVDALATGGENVAWRAAKQLERHPKLAGPLLRERLEDPKLPNWTIAANALAGIAPDEFKALEAKLGKKRPALTTRYHLWRLAQNKSWSWDPFAGGDGKTPESVEPIQALGPAAAEELRRAMADDQLRRHATWVIGVLKVEQAVPELLRHIRDTRVYTSGGRTGPPPRTN